MYDHSFLRDGLIHFHSLKLSVFCTCFLCKKDTREKRGEIHRIQSFSHSRVSCLHVAQNSAYTINSFIQRYTFMLIHRYMYVCTYVREKRKRSISNERKYAKKIKSCNAILICRQDRLLNLQIPIHIISRLHGLSGFTKKER